MIGVCSKCGNHDWDKEVTGNQIKCPKCGDTWDFIQYPLLILTGCSGVGKTSTLIEIQKRKVDFVALDGDIFYSFTTLETEEDYKKQIEAIENISKNIMQSGTPVLWTLTGTLDKLNWVYNRRFFPSVQCLALVCDDDLLEKRMREGRGITDEKWIQSSVEYNQYFKSHDKLGDTEFSTFDISGKEVSEVADYVMEWVKKVLG